MSTGIPNTYHPATLMFLCMSLAFTLLGCAQPEIPPLDGPEEILAVLLTLDELPGGWRKISSNEFGSRCDGGNEYRHGFTTNLAYLLSQPVYMHHRLIKCQSSEDAQQSYRFDPADSQFPARLLPVELPLADRVVAYCVDYPNQTTACKIYAHYGWLVSGLWFTTPTANQGYPQPADLIELAKEMDKQLAELGKE